MLLRATNFVMPSLLNLDLRVQLALPTCYTFIQGCISKHVQCISNQRNQVQPIENKRRTNLVSREQSIFF